MAASHSRRAAHRRRTLFPIVQREERIPVKTRLNCPCGEHLTGATEDELVDVVRKHLTENHPGHDYSRDEILFIAY